MANSTIGSPTKTSMDTVASAERTRSGHCYRPNVDILERGDELLVVADVPGAKRDGIEIDFEDGTLRIHANVDLRQPEGTEYLLREYGVGDYYREFQVSEAIDASQITAEYGDGVLTLHLPKSEAVKPRKISVAGK